MTLSTSISGEWQLDARAQVVLAWIIKEHLVTGEPVGSRTVAELCAATDSWSPATIRNTMAELEEANLVEQPHTSAGRVPTDKGYRFFVDHLVAREKGLSRSDVAAVNRVLGAAEANGEAGKLMGRVSHLLSQLSDSVGIVIAPPLAGNALQHIEFVQLSDKRVLVVLVFVPNIVQNRVIRLDEPLTQAELERTARYLNAEYSGKSLLQIRAEILHSMREEKRLYDQLARTAMMLCERSLEVAEENTEDVYIDGASNILTKPDFNDLSRAGELLKMLEEKSRLIAILNECINRSAPSPAWGDVRVAIGRENAAPSMQTCTLVTASYRIGTGASCGTLAIVGSMRIEYGRTMALVSHLARSIERSLCDDAETL